MKLLVVFAWAGLCSVALGHEARAGQIQILDAKALASDTGACEGSPSCNRTNPTSSVLARWALRLVNYTLASVDMIRPSKPDVEAVSVSAAATCTWPDKSYVQVGENKWCIPNGDALFMEQIGQENDTDACYSLCAATPGCKHFSLYLSFCLGCNAGNWDELSDYNAYSLLPEKKLENNHFRLLTYSKRCKEPMFIAQTTSIVACYQKCAVTEGCYYFSFAVNSVKGECRGSKHAKLERAAEPNYHVTYEIPRYVLDM